MSDLAGADDIAAGLVSTGIVSLKTANPAAWTAFKISLRTVACVTSALSRMVEDDKLTASEITGAISQAKDYGAMRTVQDVLWGILKHVKG